MLKKNGNIGASLGRINRVLYLATYFATIRDDLKMAGAHYEDREVMVYTNLVTSRSPENL